MFRSRYIITGSDSFSYQMSSNDILTYSPIHFLSCFPSGLALPATDLQLTHLCSFLFLCNSNQSENSPNWCFHDGPLHWISHFTSPRKVVPKPNTASISTFGDLRSLLPGERRIAEWWTWGQPGRKNYNFNLRMMFRSRNPNLSPGVASRMLQADNQCHRLQ
jgi:hypothetical protein